MKEIEFDKEGACLLSELVDCMGAAYSVCEELSECIDLFYGGSKVQFIIDVSRNSDYYNLLYDLKHLL